MIASFRGPYGFLSNFYPVSFMENGVLYRSMEHYFQYKKATNPDDEHARCVLTAATPSQAKYWGRALTLRADWEQVKLQVMRDGLALKFQSRSDLAGQLITTHPHTLQEGNTWGDVFWGVCGGQGQNWLGVLLMARRAELMGQ